SQDGHIISLSRVPKTGGFMIKYWRTPLLLGFLFCVWTSATVTRSQAAHRSTSPKRSAGQTRIYYIAADEVTWDYAPGGINRVMGRPFAEEESIWVASGPHQIGKVLKKALYHEYTDATFA